MQTIVQQSGAKSPERISCQALTDELQGVLATQGAEGNEVRGLL